MVKVARSENEGRMVVYRRHFEMLLSFPKPLRDQLVLELPTLEAFRTGEVSSLIVEHIDFERGDLTVLDSKKNKLFPVPLHPVVAEHLAKYIEQERIESGVVIKPLRGAPHVGRKPGSKTQGLGLSINHLADIWADSCRAAGVPVMTPRMGRAYFATKWAFVERKSLLGLMAVLRHDDLQSTEHYLDKLIDYEDTKAEYYRGLKAPFGSSCARAESCPVSCEDCQCKFYQPRIEGTIRVGVSEQIP